MNTTKRLTAATLSVLSIAVLGTGSMTSASAAEAGVTTQTLQPATRVQAAAAAVADPAALPTRSASMRFAVDPSGSLRKL